MTPPPRGKAAERAYPSRLDESGQSWLPPSPSAVRRAKTGRHLIDAGYLIQLLGIAPQPRLEICEMGCGSGWMSLLLGRAGADVVGIDLSPDMIAIANQRRDDEGLPNVTFLVGDMEEVPPKLVDRFDRCLFYEALHHSPDAGAALRSARRMLRTGGQVVLVEPNWKHRFQGRAATRKYGVTECGYSSRQLKGTAPRGRVRRHRAVPQQPQAPLLERGPRHAQPPRRAARLSQPGAVLDGELAPRHRPADSPHGRECATAGSADRRAGRRGGPRCASARDFLLSLLHSNQIGRLALWLSSRPDCQPPALVSSRSMYQTMPCTCG